MFPDASWPAHGVFLGHLSLSLSAFVFEAWPDMAWQIYTARGLITRARSASGINDVMEIPTAIIAFQCVTDIHTYNA